MSISTVDMIIGRIKLATAESPISVFRCHVPGRLNAVFSNTVLTRKMVASGGYGYVGTFTRDDNLIDLKSKLITAAMEKYNG